MQRRWLLPKINKNIYIFIYLFNSTILFNIFSLSCTLLRYLNIQFIYYFTYLLVKPYTYFSIIKPLFKGKFLADSFFKHRFKNYSWTNYQNSLLISGVKNQYTVPGRPTNLYTLFYNYYFVFFQLLYFNNNSLFSFNSQNIHFLNFKIKLTGKFKLFNLSISIFFTRFFLLFNLLFNLFSFKKNFFLFSSNILNSESNSLNLYQYFNIHKYTNFITFYNSLNYSINFKALLRKFKTFNINFFITSNINKYRRLFYFLGKNSLVSIGMVDLYSNPWVLYFPLIFVNLNLYIEILFIGLIVNIYNLIYNLQYLAFLKFFNFKKFTISLHKQFLIHV